MITVESLIRIESLVCDTLDLSGQGLKKLARCPSDADISILIIDDNELQRLDNLDSYNRITKVSFSNVNNKICGIIYCIFLCCHVVFCCHIHFVLVRQL